MCVCACVRVRVCVFNFNHGGKALSPDSKPIASITLQQNCIKLAVGKVYLSRAHVLLMRTQRKCSKIAKRNLQQALCSRVASHLQQQCAIVRPTYCTCACSEIASRDLQKAHCRRIASGKTWSSKSAVIALQVLHALIERIFLGKWSMHLRANIFVTFQSNYYYLTVKKYTLTVNTRQNVKILQSFINF